MREVMYVLGTMFLLVVTIAVQDKYHQKRREMVSEHIEARGVKDKHTLEAMRSVKRHQLVPNSQLQYAYEDRPLPIGKGQTISQPFIVAYMTAAIEPRPGMKVLEIGTGSGYQAAVLAEIVDSVYTIETVEALAKRAESKLDEMGYTNIQYKIGDGYFGWEEHAPFDAIIVTAAPEFLPPKLVDQLRVGGRMVIPVGASFNTQHLLLVEKEADGSYKTRNLMPVRFVPFTRERE